ncbi:unnamed protein product [Camellia sinensis]
MTFFASTRTTTIKIIIIRGTLIPDWIHFYQGNKQEVGYAEMCVLDACYVGNIYVGNPEDYVS